MDSKLVTKKEVTEDHEGMRLDNYLISSLKGVPRSKIYSIIRKGEVRVNSKRYKPKQRVSIGDIIRIPPIRLRSSIDAMPSSELLDFIKSNIIFEDKSLLVIDKPSGIASHGGSGISLGLIEVARKLDTKYENLQLVHRLDKDTSGCIVLTKKKSILREMHKELRNNTVRKNYILVTPGNWKQEKVEVNLNLEKIKKLSGEQRVEVVESGKKSLSIFTVIKDNQKFALVNCVLKTGRTHQIRVHTNFLQHPIAGDRKYGDKEFNKLFFGLGYKRMMLHAKSIKFEGLDFSVESPTPFEFNKIFKS